MRNTLGGSITKLRNGRFWVRTHELDDGTRKPLGTYATREEAESQLAAFMLLHAKKNELPPETATVASFGREVLRIREEDGIRGVSKELSRFKKHVEGSPLGNVPLSKVTPADVSDFARWLTRKDASDKRGKRKLGHSTVLRCISLVSIIFTEAVHRGRVATNPCVGVKVRKRSEEATKEVWTFLSPEEQALLITCEKIPYADRLLIRFAMGTGIRQGELCHNVLSDLHVDGPEPHLFVRYGSKGKPPKNGKTRIVPLFGDALVAAKEWLELRKTYLHKPRHSRHEVRLDADVIFPTPTGCRRQPGKPLGNGRKVGTKWEDKFKSYCTVAGIRLRPGLHWHSLRHTCATSLLEGWWGQPWALEEVKEMLGHSSITVTQRYAHHAGTRLRAAAARTSGAVTSPGYGLVTGNGGAGSTLAAIVNESAGFDESHLRDLNSRPTVYESTGESNSSLRLIAKDPQKSTNRNHQERLGGLAREFLDHIFKGRHPNALAVGVTLANAILIEMGAGAVQFPVTKAAG